MKGLIWKPMFNRILRGLLVSLMIAITLSVILLLLEHPIKYALYIFGLSLTALLFLTHVSGYYYKIRLITPQSVRFVDYLLIACSITLLASNVFVRPTPIVSFILAIVASFFLPGWALLRLLGVNCGHISYIGLLVLPFSLSIGLTPLILTIALPFTTHRATLISAIYLAISLLPLLRIRLSKSSGKPQIHSDNRTSEYNLLDALLLAWIPLFFIFTISSLYPQMAYFPGSDIVRHFSSSKLLILAPDAYQSAHLWFHLTLGAVYELSSPMMWIFQTGLAYLSIIVVFSFYIMAKAYLNDVDKRAPMLATVFFSVFSGFGWLYFLQKRLSIPDPAEYFHILGMSNDVSYWDIGFGQGPWIWFWFRPMTLAFTLFFVLLYFLRRNDISKRTFVAIFSLMIVTLGLVHFPELILFNVFLTALVLFIPKTVNLRLQEASLSTLVGSVTFSFYAWISGMLAITAIPVYMSLVLAGTAMLPWILSHIFPRRWTNYLANCAMRFAGVFAVATALVFMTGLLTWLSSPEIFSVRLVYEIYYIPLILYPVLLGITVFFALHGLALISKRYRSSAAIIFVYLFVLTLAFGKLVSFLNASFLDLGYGERRYLPVIFATASVMAAVSFIKLIPLRVRAHVFYKANKVKARVRVRVQLLRYRRRIYSPLLLALIVVTGVMSTNLSVEYWKLTTETPIMSQYTLDAIEYLSLPRNRDIRTPILTAPTFTTSMVEFIPSPYVFTDSRRPIWESRHPEASLLILYNQRYPPPYLYLDYRDFNHIANPLVEGYFTNHMLHLLPKVYNNTEVTILRVPEGTPPSLDSKVVLVLPDDGSDDYLLAYDMLSLGGYGYTVSLYSDIRTIESGEKILVPYDNSDFVELWESLSLHAESSQKQKKVIIFNLNGYGPLASLFFESGTQGEDVKAAYVEGSKYSLDLPIEMDAPPLIARDGVRVLAWYTDGKVKTPFAAELVTSKKEAVYINVYPIVRAALTEEPIIDYVSFQVDTNPLSSILGDLIDIAGVNLTSQVNYEAWVMGGNLAFFKDALLKGKIVIESSSFTDFKVEELENLTIATDHDPINVTDIKELYIKGIDHAEIYAEEAKINQGRGFYADLTVVNPTLSLSGDDVLILLITSNQGKSEITLQKGELAILGQLRLHARAPHLQVHGEATFEEIYSGRLRSSGQDLNIQGTLQFQLPVSDIYSFASDLKWSGSFSREPPILPWSWSNSIKNMLPWLIISVVLVVFWHAFFRKETPAHKKKVKRHVA